MIIFLDSYFAVFLFLIALEYGVTLHNLEQALKN